MESSKLSRMDSIDDGQRPRKMRKGTHSCFECKRRKVRCTIPSSSGSSCVECELRGSVCVSQDYAGAQAQLQNNKGNVRDRIGRLEALVESLIHKTDLPGASIDEQQRAAAHTLESITVDPLTPSSESSLDTPGHLENAPLLSLFDNAVLSRKRDISETRGPAVDAYSQEQLQLQSPVSSTVSHHGRHARICQALLAVLPPQDQLMAIFDATAAVWKLWLQLSPCFIGDVQYDSFPEFISVAMSKGQPNLMARVVICFAVSVQQLSTSEYRRLGLPSPVDSTLERYISTARRLVTSQDDLVCNLDGIDCLDMLAKYHVNAGQPRKAWLVLKRAVSLAQLLGIHRDANSPALPESPSARRRRRLWWDLYQCDHFSSLFLGLPYSSSDKNLESGFEVGPDRPQEFEQRYRVRLSVLCGRITDLHQSHPCPTMQDLEEIDAQLEGLARSTPKGWWEIGSGPALGAATSFERNLIQFWHCHVRIILHLPFMLRSGCEPRFERSRTICLTSAREMIKRFELLRFCGSQSASYSCKLLDFEAFTAATILLLNLLETQRGRRARGLSYEHPDWAIVDGVIELMRDSTTQAGSVVAAQALKVLETLRSGRDHDMEADMCRGKTLTLAIPFFGTVTIAPGAQLHCAAPAAAAAATLTPPTPDLTPEHESAPAGTPLSGAGTGTGTAGGGSTPSSNTVVASDPLISINSMHAQTLLAGSDPWSSSSLSSGAALDGAAADDAFLSRALNFDLDQDWNWLLDDPNLQS